MGHLVGDAESGEDKIERIAKLESIDTVEIAYKFENIYFEDMRKLNVLKPSISCRATGHIIEIIEDVQTLIDKGYAYATKEGNVYYRINKFTMYGSLSNRTLDNTLSGERIEVATDKENPADFALWKKAENGHIMKWPSPWGEGYPGWHIECSCISMKHLGEYMDIHCGGVDNIFPHHTNEIAQSESYLGHKWCNYWFHVHHLNDRNGKMSKSNGEFLTVSVLEEKGYDPLVYRLFCLQSHYRKPLEFTYEIMDNTKAAYNKLVKRIGELKEDGEVDKTGFDKYKTDFKAALENDINKASAITVVYDVLRSDLNDATKLALVKDFDYVLSLNLTRMQGENAAPKADDELTAFVEAKIEERKAAKKEKDFAKADAIRDELLAKGVRIKDTREGVVWELV